MAFIVLRRSRNTRSYYLVESYRDEHGRVRRRTLCYLGREQDGTDSLAKAKTHWERVRENVRRELSGTRGTRHATLRRRHDMAEARLRLLKTQIERATSAEAERRRHQQLAEERAHWQAFERLRRDPSEHHAREAKRAFLLLAKRHHPKEKDRL